MEACNHSTYKNLLTKTENKGMSNKEIQFHLLSPHKPWIVYMSNSGTIMLEYTHIATET